MLLVTQPFDLGLSCALWLGRPHVGAHGCRQCQQCVELAVACCTQGVALSPLCDGVPSDGRTCCAARLCRLAALRAESHCNIEEGRNHATRSSGGECRWPPLSALACQQQPAVRVVVQIVPPLPAAGRRCTLGPQCYEQRLPRRSELVWACIQRGATRGQRASRDGCMV